MGSPLLCATFPFAASRARSFVAYQPDRSRHSPRGSLRFVPQNEFLEVTISRVFWSIFTGGVVWLYCHM